MQVKSFIAIIFVMIFSGKLVTIDSKLLGVIFNSEEIILVNPFCEKNISKISQDKLRFNQASSINNISVHVICASPFQFEVHKSLISQTKPYYHEYNYQTQSIISAYRDKFYPPPKA
ncbi:MAG: hypothetical protein CVU08_03505 [Bacteroidetes bacterium HGW-Bacteroidetes-3]|nr:MAG: hypothetical protein CVU08_03505 [Bacteroidetes bacterium HGW-Bacteroidetes-3]